MNDYAETPKSLMARMNGTNTHRLMEKHNPEGAEHEIFVGLSRGYRFGGTMDKNLKTVIKDYKSTDNPTKTLGGGTRLTEDGTKIHLHSDQLSTYADLVELAGVDTVERLEIVQVGRRDAATHEAYRVAGALDRATERAELLIDAVEYDECSLTREGKEIKFWQATACSFCVFSNECLGGCDAS
jgi:hypothetical protein